MGHVDPLSAWKPQDWALGRVLSTICPRARYALARTLPSRPAIDHSRKSDGSVDGGHPIVEHVELVIRRCASDATGCGGVVPLVRPVGDRWEQLCAHLPGATPLGPTSGARWPAQSRGWWAPGSATSAGQPSLDGPSGDRRPEIG